MDCRQLTQIVARGDTDRLGLRQRLALRLHMKLCPPCRCYAEQMDQLGEMACEDVERKMSEDCCAETLKRLETSILEDCGLAESQTPEET